MRILPPSRLKPSKDSITRRYAELAYHPVTKAVSNPRSQGAELIVPVSG